MVPHAVKVASVVLTYWTISISMVFSNKYLVGDRKSKKDVTMFVAWVQCLFTVVIMSVVQVARSLTLIFTVIFSVLILQRVVSAKSMLCCLLVAAGFVLGVDQEQLAGTLSVQGVAFGVVTSMFVALSGIFTKRALGVVEQDSTRLTLYNNINAVIVFLPLIAFTDQLENLSSSGLIHSNSFWLFLCVSGVLGSLMGWISAVQINLTSPVTHHIAANTKAVLQTIIAVLYYDEFKSVLWWFSMCLVVIGALLYTIVNLKDGNRKAEVQSNHKDVTAA